MGLRVQVAVAADLAGALAVGLRRETVGDLAVAEGDRSGRLRGGDLCHREARDTGYHHHHGGRDAAPNTTGYIMPPPFPEPRFPPG